MELVKAIILGIVQGVTEFLPISSSGHLVIGSELLNFQEQGVTFDVFLHLGTLCAVILVFRHEIMGMVRAPFLYLAGHRDQQVKRDLQWIGLIVVATLPAVAVGLFAKSSIEAIFSHLGLVFFMLFITGCLMILTTRLKGRGVGLRWGSALIIGCAQAMAILPGLSRSGSTIFAGMALGIDRQLVARFSFIMSIPAILGAVVLQLGDVFAAPDEVMISTVMLAAGTISAAVSGYFSIILLLDIVKKNRLQWFGYYCLLLSCAGGLYLFVA